MDFIFSKVINTILCLTAVAYSGLTGDEGLCCLLAQFKHAVLASDCLMIKLTLRGLIAIQRILAFTKTGSLTIKIVGIKGY